MHIKRIFITLLFFGFSFVVEANTQNGSPFDLLPRLPEPVIEAIDTVQETPSDINPFDIIADESLITQKRKTNQPVRTVPLTEEEIQDKSYRFRFGLVVFILFCLSILLTILRSVISKSIRAFLNSNLFNQLYREQQGRGILAYLLLYAMYIILFGIFIFLCLEHYQIDVAQNQFLELMYCIGGVFAVFVGKHLLLSIVGNVFPIEKEMSKYHFIIIIFGIIIGILLAPINLLLAFGPENFAETLIYATFIAILLIYLFRYSRSIPLASKQLVFHKFHFLLYICTIEIAPAVILLKLILSGI
ncbi:MAG: DUF4271 domain-containing protein [Bacteroidota bacterium]